MHSTTKRLIITGLAASIQLFALVQSVAQSGQFPEIKIYIPKSQLADLKLEAVSKLVFSNPTLLVNGDTTHVKEIHARGNNSLKFQRKSLSVELDKAITLELNQEPVKLKKFNLISLSMDKNLWHNRFANLSLETAGLFPLFNTYCTVWINGETQGVYLLIEKPQHYQVACGSPYMLRRGTDHKITDEYFDDDDIETAKKFRKQYQLIYSTVNGKEPRVFDDVNQLLNLPFYFRWMAFNYLVMNGDYSDEVYFIINPKSNLFEIIPWDFDDLLRFAPHEGMARRKLSHTDKKIFSLEDKLDLAIANRTDLYTEYENELKKLLLELDSSVLTEQCNRVLRELDMISTAPEIAQASLFLDQQPFDYNSAKGDILMSLDLILKRRKWILQEIK